jgi:hypothetical protein
LAFLTAHNEGSSPPLTAAQPTSSLRLAIRIWRHLPISPSTGALYADGVAALRS